MMDDVIWGARKWTNSGNINIDWRYCLLNLVGWIWSRLQKDEDTTQLTFIGYPSAAFMISAGISNIVVTILILMFPFRFQWYAEAIPPENPSSFYFDLKNFLYNKSQATWVHLPAFSLGGALKTPNKRNHGGADGIFRDHFAQWTLRTGEGGDGSKGGRCNKAGTEEDVVTQRLIEVIHFF